jgi:hypothetical protein
MNFRLAMLMGKGRRSKGYADWNAWNNTTPSSRGLCVHVPRIIPKTPVLGLDPRMEAGFCPDHAQTNNSDHDPIKLNQIKVEAPRHLL